MNILEMKREDNRYTGFLTNWVYALGQACYDDDGKELWDMLRDMSESEVEALMDELDETCSDGDALEFFSRVYEMQQQETYDDSDMTISYLPNCGDIEMSESEREYIRGLLVEQWPTRRFVLDIPAFQKLFGFWHLQNDSRYIYHVPSDLLFMQEIPFTDIEFSIENLFEHDPGFEPVVRVKVMDCFGKDNDIDPDDDLLRALNENDGITVTTIGGDSDSVYTNDDVLPIGIMTFPLNKEDTKGVIITFGIQHGMDVLLLHDNPMFYGMTKADASGPNNLICFDDADFVQICTTFLQIWYTIQVFATNEKLAESLTPMIKNKDRRKNLCGQLCRKIARPLPITNITEHKFEGVLDNHNLKKDSNINYLVGGWETVNGEYVFVNGRWYEREDLAYRDWNVTWEELRSICAEKIMGCDDCKYDGDVVSDVLAEFVK